VIALSLLKGGLQAAHDIGRESAEKALRDAEAAEEQARADRRAVEAKLNEERRASTKRQHEQVRCIGCSAVYVEYDKGRTYAT
jgi:hypothetical protein